MGTDKNKSFFFSLLRAGLWRSKARFLSFDGIDYEAVWTMAQEQGVVGLLLDGMDLLETKPPKSILLRWLGQVQMIEHKNREMNHFISRLFGLLGSEGIHALLVKGQGIAQCYEKPLLRTCGDVDLLLDRENYEKAKSVLGALASEVDEENPDNLHLSMTIDPWTVEIHGSLRSGLWRRMDRAIDEVQSEAFLQQKVRIWDNEGVAIPLPAANVDVIFVFSHILQHFYKEGVGLRQICDWCRLLWRYKDVIERDQLEKRLRAMDVMSEWHAFAMLAVEWLGMPREAMPFYDESARWKRKASKVMAFVMETGSFGYKRDYSYIRKHRYAVYKAMSLWRHVIDSIRYFQIFPRDSLRVLMQKIQVGLATVKKGE